MKKLLFMTVCLSFLFCAGNLSAQELPTISTKTLIEEVSRNGCKVSGLDAYMVNVFSRLYSHKNLSAELKCDQIARAEAFLFDGYTSSNGIQKVFVLAGYRKDIKNTSTAGILCYLRILESKESFPDNAELIKKSKEELRTRYAMKIAEFKKKKYKVNNAVQGAFIEHLITLLSS